MGVLIATAEDREGPIFIASNEAVTEAQVRNKLQSEGWTDIRIMQQGLYLEATGSQEGSPEEDYGQFGVGAISRRRQR